MPFIVGPALVEAALLQSRVSRVCAINTQNQFLLFVRLIGPILHVH